MAKKNRKRPSQFQNPLLSNASKTLFANIRFVSIDEKVKTIVVTSTGMDEGKTIVEVDNAAFAEHFKDFAATNYPQFADWVERIAAMDPAKG